MKLRSLAVALLFSLIAVACYAHGDKKHVIGTVEKVTSDSITVKTKDGASVEVKLAATTTYLLHEGTTDKPAKLSDLAVGNRVSIHATPKDNVLIADEVKFAAATAAPSSPKS